MAATTSFSVSAATIAGVALSEVDTLSLTYGANVASKAVDGGANHSALAIGGKTSNVSVTSLDPTTAYAAVKTSGAGSFTVTQGCAGSGSQGFTLADGTSSLSIGESFEFDSGGPGELGSVTLTAVLTGNGFAAT